MAPVPSRDPETPSPETKPIGCISLHVNLAILTVMAFLRAAGKGPAKAECAE